MPLSIVMERSPCGRPIVNTDAGDADGILPGEAASQGPLEDMPRLIPADTDRSVRSFVVSDWLTRQNPDGPSRRRQGRIKPDQHRRVPS